MPLRRGDQYQFGLVEPLQQELEAPTEERDIPQRQALPELCGVANAAAARIPPTGVGGLLRPRGEPSRSTLRGILAFKLSPPFDGRGLRGG